MTAIVNIKSKLKNTMLIRYLAAVVVLLAVCIFAFSLSHTPKNAGSIEMYGLSVKMPKGADRSEILEGGGRAVLYKDDTVVGGVKFLRYSLKDTDGITIENDAKQVGRRKYAEEEDMHVVSVRFERPYPKDSGKTGSYIEKHVCLVPAGGEYVMDFYEVEKAARSGTVEYMRKNWITLKTAPRPGEGWTELFVNLSAMEEEQRLSNMGNESKYKYFSTVGENVVAEIIGNKNDYEALKINKDMNSLYYYPCGSEMRGIQNADGTRTTLADLYYTLKDNRCIAVRCTQPVQQDQDGIWAAIGWREYQPVDLPPFEPVQDGKLAQKDKIVYNEYIYQYETQDGEKKPVLQKTVSHNVELLDAFATAMFEEKPCDLKVGNAYFFDGQLGSVNRWKQIIYDGEKAILYNRFVCLDQKYRCYMPEEFVQLNYRTASSGAGVYYLQPADTGKQTISLFSVYEE